MLVVTVKEQKRIRSGKYLEIEKGGTLIFSSEQQDLVVYITSPIHNNQQIYVRRL